MPETLQEQLVVQIQDAHAMEANVLRMLETMISTTKDEGIRGELEHHKEETARHKQLLAERLEAHDAQPSKMRDITAQGGAMMKGLIDLARDEKTAKNARDGFTTEHLEIATYELLERFARRACDEATAEIAKRNRRDEEAMAQKIAANWDKFVDLTVREENLADEADQSEESEKATA
jgi:ferritin-like metal-binding protein YciE